jgi:hypothetical protein
MRPLLLAVAFDDGFAVRKCPSATSPPPATTSSSSTGRGRSARAPSPPGVRGGRKASALARRVACPWPGGRGPSACKATRPSRGGGGVQSAGRAGCTTGGGGPRRGAGPAAGGGPVFMTGRPRGPRARHANRREALRQALADDVPEVGQLLLQEAAHHLLHLVLGAPLQLGGQLRAPLGAVVPLVPTAAGAPGRRMVAKSGGRHGRRRQGRLTGRPGPGRPAPRRRAPAARPAGRHPWSPPWRSGRGRREATAPAARGSTAQAASVDRAGRRGASEKVLAC